MNVLENVKYLGKEFLLANCESRLPIEYLKTDKWPQRLHLRIKFWVIQYTDW